VTPAARERLAERVGPREHGRATRAQNERRRRVAEVLDAKSDAVRLDRRHHTNPAAMTTPEAWYEQIAGYIVASRAASWTVAPGTTAKQRIPASFVAPSSHDRPAFSGMDNRRDENSSPCRMGIPHRESCRCEATPAQEHPTYPAR
jgi:hypothetical protein